MKENNCIVQGIGIADSFPVVGNNSMFSQDSIYEIVKIPEQKPNMEQLVSIIETVDVLCTKIVDTGIGLSEENRNLTGKKLIVEVLLKQKITYVADEPTQSVHAAHFEKPVSIFVVVPKKIGGIAIEDLFIEEKLVIKPYIEDICGIMLNKREIFKCTALFLHVHECE